MTVALDRIVANPTQAVSSRAVNQAARQVNKDGVTTDEVRSFIDTFSQASDAGRMDAAARQAYRKQLVKLLAAAPEGGQNTVTVRLTSEGLRAELDKVRDRVEAFRAEIEALESQLAAVNRSIEAKAARATELNNKRTQLLNQIAAAKRKREKVRRLGLFAALAGVPISPAAVVIMGMSMNDAQNEANRLSGEVANVEAQKRQLEGLVGAFRDQQATMRSGLDSLRSVEHALVEAITENDETAGDSREQLVESLATEVSLNRSLAKNLRGQIQLLETMNTRAAGMDSALSGLVSALEIEVGKLEARAAQAERDLQGAIIDVMFALTGTDPNLRVGDFSFSKKMLLLDGVDYLRLSFQQQIDGLVDRMITRGLVDATGSRALAKAILVAVRGKDAGAALSATARAELNARAMAELTDAQRFAIDVIRRRGRGAGASELIQLVLHNAALTDTQVRAVAMILDGSGSSDAKKAATREVLEDGVDAAMVVMRHRVEAGDQTDDPGAERRIRSLFG